MGSLEVAVTYFMTPKVGDLCDRFDLVYDPKGHGVMVAVLLYDPKGWPLWPSLWPQRVMGSLEVAVTYFMTPKVTVTFVIGLT